MMRQLLPFTRVIWSDIMPRLAYPKEAAMGAGKRSTININRFAHQICKSVGNAYIIRHSRLFNPRRQHEDGRQLFADDVHPTEWATSSLLGKLCPMRWCTSTIAQHHSLTHHQAGSEIGMH
jgi:hypothetical protein